MDLCVGYCHLFLSFSYRFQNRFRPTYKIAFKTVTELEWRCCPGYHGLNCRDLKPPPHRQTVPGIQPYPVPNPGYTTRHTQSKTSPAAFTRTSVSWLSASSLLRAQRETLTLVTNINFQVAGDYILFAQVAVLLLLYQF